jgi:transposase-like protein
MEGKKEVLGLYLSESEGANFWLSVLTDLSNRGAKDILIASVDGLTGFPEAINATFPETEGSSAWFTKFATRCATWLLNTRKCSWWI